MRKIGELKGKPIIEGNPNEIKKNQIHYKESDGGITLSERKEDNILSSVTSGSGSGEGVKEYYYKVLNPIEEVLAVFINPSEIIRSISQETNERITVVVGTTDTGTFSYYPLYWFLTNNEVIAFKVLDREEYIRVGSEITVLPKGNLYTRLALLGEGEDVGAFLDTIFQEITKEEYESMITYKPE